MHRYAALEFVAPRELRVVDAAPPGSGGALPAGCVEVRSPGACVRWGRRGWSMASVAISPLISLPVVSR